MKPAPGSALALAAVIVGLAWQAKAAPMTAIEKLVAENEITQQVARYELLADGDAAAAADIRALADDTLTPDVVTDVYTADGKRISHTTTSQEIVSQTPPKPANRPVGGRHFLLATYFDEITPTTARTRTPALYLEVTKNPGPGCETLGPDGCGGKVTHAVTFIYHDTWRKTARGWKKVTSELRRDN